MTFAEIALKIANMLAMLTHHAGRLKMPRPAAYGRRGGLRGEPHRAVPGAAAGRVSRQRSEPRDSGAGGGRVVVEGTPEDVAACAESHTGLYLARLLGE